MLELDEVHWRQVDSQINWAALFAVASAHSGHGQVTAPRVLGRTRQQLLLGGEALILLSVVLVGVSLRADDRLYLMLSGVCFALGVAGLLGWLAARRRQSTPVAHTEVLPEGVRYAVRTRDVAGRVNLTVARRCTEVRGGVLNAAERDIFVEDIGPAGDPQTQAAEAHIRAQATALGQAANAPYQARAAAAVRARYGV